MHQQSKTITKMISNHVIELDSLLAAGKIGFPIQVTCVTTTKSRIKILPNPEGREFWVDGPDLSQDRCIVMNLNMVQCMTYPCVSLYAIKLIVT
jgi:hypothetical protein